MEQIIEIYLLIPLNAILFFKMSEILLHSYRKKISKAFIFIQYREKCCQGRFHFEINYPMKWGRNLSHNNGLSRAINYSKKKSILISKSAEVKIFMTALI